MKKHDLERLIFDTALTILLSPKRAIWVSKVEAGRKNEKTRLRDTDSVETAIDIAKDLINKAGLKE